MSLLPACGGARVCYKGREDSTSSADRSINSAELVERCPLAKRHLVKRCSDGCRRLLSIVTRVAGVQPSGDGAKVSRWCAEATQHDLATCEMTASKPSDLRPHRT